MTERVGNIAHRPSKALNLLSDTVALLINRDERELPEATISWEMSFLHAGTTWNLPIILLQFAMSGVYAGIHKR